MEDTPFMGNSFLDPVKVTLADGQIYELNYGIGSLVWLRRHHNIDLMEIMSGAKDEPKEIQDARVKSILGNIDLIVMAGVMDHKAERPAILSSMINGLPARDLNPLAVAVFTAVLRDLNAEKVAEVKDPNAVPAT